MQQRRARPLALATLVVASLTGSGCGAEAPHAVVHTAGGPRTIRLEVAATPATRRRGLMYRRELADGHGMLFVFEETDHHTFWMKNTFIALDLLFIGPERTIVGVRQRTVPHSTEAVGVAAPSRWVIEVPAGWAARTGVAVGDRVEFRHLETP